MSEQKSSPEAPESETPAKKSRRRRLVAGGLGLLVLVGLLAGGGLYVWPVLRAQLSPSQPTIAASQFDALRARVERLEGRLDGLDRRFEANRAAIAALAERPASTPGETDQSADLADQLATLKQKIAALEAQPVAPDNGQLAEARTVVAEARAIAAEARADVQQTRAQIDTLSRTTAALDQRLAVVEAGLKTQLPQTLRAMALARLAQAAAGAEPYKAALDGFIAALGDEQIAPQKAALDSLAAHAERGVASRADLARQFDAMASAVMIAAAKRPEAGWLQKSWAAIAGLVRVRKLGEVAGDQPGAMLSRAETRLKAGDLAGAADEIARLSGPPRQAAADWLAAARARLALEAALEALAS